MKNCNSQIEKANSIVNGNYDTNEEMELVSSVGILINSKSFWRWMITNLAQPIEHDTKYSTACPHAKCRS